MASPRASHLVQQAWGMTLPFGSSNRHIAMSDERVGPGSALPGSVRRRTIRAMDIESPDKLIELLDRHAYLADEGLATAAFLALRMRRPLFLEGEAGVGKTELAKTLAAMLGAPLIRLQCYEGLDAAQALYDWDFARQLLHLKAAEAAGVADARPARRGDLRPPVPDRPAAAEGPGDAAERAARGRDRPGRRRVRGVPAGGAVRLQRSPSPSWARSGPRTPPVVVVTSNRTREVHDALKRRCLYHWLEHPGFDREVAILLRRLPECTETLAAQVARAAARLRQADLVKPPGVAETLDWTEALLTLGAKELDPDLAAATPGRRAEVPRGRRARPGRRAAAPWMSWPPPSPASSGRCGPPGSPPTTPGPRTSCWRSTTSM